METTNCFFTDFENLMKIHKIKNLSIVANITDDDKLTFDKDIVIIRYPDVKEDVNVFTLHQPTPDEYENFFREECR
jgi:hypothetical protein